MRLRAIGLFFLIGTFSFGQSMSNSGINPNMFGSTMSMGQSSLNTGQRNLTGNYFSVDEKKYIVDSGDEFYIKIDISGPEIKTYNVKVSSDGYIFIPEAPGLYVRGEVLISVKGLIAKHLKKYFNNADIEVFLDKTHSIHVYLSGALNRFNTVELNSGNRLYDVLEMVINNYQSDTLLVDYLNTASLRNITLNRKDIHNQYDVLKFRKTGISENPYLMNEDIIHIPYRDKTAGDITVEGLIGNPISFEFKIGDNLSDAIQFAGGLLPSADSSDIMLYRYTDNKETFRLIHVDYYNQKVYLLKSDDRIFIRRKPLYRNKMSVMVNGAVYYPGEYPIILNKTTLSEIIQQAGGITENANLNNSRLLRVNEIPGDKELERIDLSLMTSMNRLERDYWSNSSKENLYILNCDFSKIVNKNNPDDDVTLLNGDVIEIGMDIDYVYVSGAVVNPGMIKYNPDWSYPDYVEAAGGYKERAKKKNIKLIKNADENWLDARRGYVIAEGDHLFIPQRYERDLLSYAMQALSIFTQVATIILVMTSFK